MIDTAAAAAAVAAAAEDDNEDDEDAEDGATLSLNAAYSHSFSHPIVHRHRLQHAYPQEPLLHCQSQ